MACDVPSRVRFGVIWSSAPSRLSIKARRGPSALGLANQQGHSPIGRPCYWPAGLGKVRSGLGHSVDTPSWPPGENYLPHGYHPGTELLCIFPLSVPGFLPLTSKATTAFTASSLRGADSLIQNAIAKRYLIPALTPHSAPRPSLPSVPFIGPGLQTASARRPSDPTHLPNPCTPYPLHFRVPGC